MKSLIEKIDDSPVNDPVIVEEQELTILIHNVTSGFKCGSGINLEKVPQKYVSISSSGLTVTLRIDNCAVILRQSGKAISMGASSEEQALIIANKCIEILKLWRIDAAVSNFRIISLFCTTLLPWKIHIEAMVTKYPNDFIYEPEIQNFCSLKMEKGQGFLAIYPSGSIRIIGFTSEMVLNSLERSLSVFSEFRI